MEFSDITGKNLPNIPLWDRWLRN